jgi:hypothetical protein
MAEQTTEDVQAAIDALNVLEEKIVLNESFDKLIKLRVKEVVEKYGQVLAVKLVTRQTTKMIGELKQEAEAIGEAYCIRYVLQNRKKYIDKISEIAEKGEQWALQYLMGFIDNKAKRSPGAGRKPGKRKQQEEENSQTKSFEESIK